MDGNNLLRTSALMTHVILRISVTIFQHPFENIDVFFFLENIFLNRAARMHPSPNTFEFRWKTVHQLLMIIANFFEILVPATVNNMGSLLPRTFKASLTGRVESTHYYVGSFTNSIFLLKPENESDLRSMVSVP